MSEWVSEWAIAIRLPTKLMEDYAIHEQKLKIFKFIFLNTNTWT